MSVTMIKWRILCSLVILAAGIVPVSAQSLPAQAQGTHDLLKNYVGHISQSFDSEFVYFMQSLKGEFERRGQREAAGSIERYLQGGAGTGLVYVAADGANYIITGYQNIALASGLSIRFEGAADRTAYTGLSIVAVDEELDIALLTFEKGERPFTRSLSLLKRRLWEEETVYSAGFPGGEDAKWQFGEGVISGTYVRIPSARIPGDDETMRMQGPYIRHNARTDQESSGGLLLVAEPGALTGYAVAGISSSATSEDGRSANTGRGPAYAIPIDRVEDFLAKALGEKSGEGWIALEERLLAFSRLVGLRSPYWHIAPYLSTSYIAENTADIIPTLNGASGTTIEEIVKAFNYSPARGINLAAAWAVENRLRNGKAAIGIEAETIEMLGTELYHTGLYVSGQPAGALWVNEYGIWRILSFDKPAEEHAETTENTDPGDTGDQAARLRTSYLFSFSAGYGYVFNKVHTLTVESALHLWVLAFGTRIYYGGSPYLRGEGLIGLHFPIRIKNRIGIIPFTGAGIGFVRKDNGNNPANSGGGITNFDLCISGQGGIRITSSLIPGLFLQGMYQYNYEIFNRISPNPHTLSVSIGYGF
ncbi:MAG: serine protease [Treponema sp.]|jgi:hypothetical protein|nr:serine protease [Treponema sp.]